MRCKGERSQVVFLCVLKRGGTRRQTHAVRWKEEESTTRKEEQIKNADLSSLVVPDCTDTKRCLLQRQFET